MSAFDNEPSPGGGYERAIAVPLTVEDAVPRRLVMRFRGRPLQRVSVILEEIREGIHGALMRYDDAYGRFHRHFPGWPEPSREIAAFFDDIPVRRRAAFAEDEIKARYTDWEAEVFGREGGEPI